MSHFFKRILAVTDPTAKAQPALVRALDVARAFACPLEVFACIYDQYLAGERFLDSDGLKRARDGMAEATYTWLEQQLAGLQVAGVDLSIQVGWHSPLHEGIIRRAEKTGADLVIKDTHYHPRLERALFSNTDWALIRGLAQTLWLVKPGSPPPGRIWLAAVDPGHEHDKPAVLDRSILDLAGALRGRLGGRLHVVHAYPRVSNATLSISAIPGAVAYPLELPEQQVEEDRRAALDNLLHGRDVEADCRHLEAGEAGEVLLSMAGQLSAGAVVMGAVARSAIKRLIIGSTAERVLDELPCDVVIARVEPGVPLAEP